LNLNQREPAFLQEGLLVVLAIISLTLPSTFFPPQPSSYLLDLHLSFHFPKFRFTMDVDQETDIPPAPFGVLYIPDFVPDGGPPDLSQK
jgi:hypothetical protein